MSIWICGFDGFTKLLHNDKVNLQRNVKMLRASDDVKVPLSLDKNCCSCAWENLLFMQESSICINGFCGCELHSVHQMKLHDYDLLSGEKITTLVNNGSNFGALTASGKFKIFEITCQNHLTAKAVPKLSLLYKIENVHFVDCRCNQSKYLVCSEDEKILTIQRNSATLSFTISSELLFKKKIKQIKCGNDHNLILSSDGQIYSWGIGSRGQLGQNDMMPRDQPMLVEALDGVMIRQIACGGWHSVALADTNDLYTWGWNNSGQLGFPAPKDVLLSAVQPKATHATFTNKKEDAIDSTQSSMKSHNEDSASKLKSDPTNNDSGRLDFDSSEIDFEPVSVLMTPTLLELERYLAVGENEFVEISDVACGSRHTVAVTSSGEVLSWGWGKYGQLGQKCCANDSTAAAKQTCEGAPHLPGLVQFSNDRILIKNVLCGPWNTLFFEVDDDVS